MSLLKTYCFCASLRLAVIVVGVFGSIKSIILIVLFFVRGINVLDEIFERMQHNPYYTTNVAMKRTIKWLVNDPKTVLVLVQLFNFGHITAAICGIYGALKLKKWFVLPLTIFQCFYLTHVLIGHIVIMTMMKKFISISLMVALTIVGGTYVLIVFYDCLALLSFIQVVMLVQSAHYKAFYGNDPFKPVFQQPIAKKQVQPPKSNSQLWAVKNTNISHTEKSSSKLWLVESLTFNEQPMSNQNCRSTMAQK